MPVLAGRPRFAIRAQDNYFFATMTFNTKCNLWIAGMLAVAALAGAAIVAILAPGPVGNGIALTKAFAVAAVVIILLMVLGTLIGTRRMPAWLLADQTFPLAEQLERTSNFLREATRLLEQDDVAGLRRLLAARQAERLATSPAKTTQP